MELEITRTTGRMEMLSRKEFSTVISIITLEDVHFLNDWGDPVDSRTSLPRSATLMDSATDQNACSDTLSPLLMLI